MKIKRHQTKWSISQSPLREGRNRRKKSFQPQSAGPTSHGCCFCWSPQCLSHSGETLDPFYRDGSGSSGETEENANIELYAICLKHPEKEVQLRAGRFTVADGGKSQTFSFNRSHWGRGGVEWECVFSQQQKTALRMSNSIKHSRSRIIRSIGLGG